MDIKKEFRNCSWIIFLLLSFTFLSSCSKDDDKTIDELGLSGTKWRNEVRTTSERTITEYLFTPENVTKIVTITVFSVTDGNQFGFTSSMTSYGNYHSFMIDGKKLLVINNEKFVIGDDVMVSNVDERSYYKQN